MTFPSPFARRIRFAWRLVFVVSVLVLCAGTHWPNLGIGPEVPASDKTIHLAVFAALSWLLWRTRWISSRLVTLLAVAVFALLNEWSQGLPFVNRHSSVADGIANLMGVAVGGLWLWALAPVGETVNRRRLATVQHAWERLFHPLRAWVLIGLLSVPFLAVAAFALLRLPADTARMVILGSMVTGFMSLHAALVLAMRRSIRCVRSERRCLSCDAPVPDFPGAGDLPDPAFAAGTCAACGRVHPKGTWADLGTPSPRAMTRAGGLSLAVVLTGSAALLGLIMLFPVLYAAALSGGGGRLTGLVRIDQGLSEAVDLMLLLLFLSVAVRLYRSRIAAALLDRADRCIACGYDLTGTPIQGGIGRCGECGQGFIALGESVPVVGDDESSLLPGTPAALSGSGDGRE